MINLERWVVDVGVACEILEAGAVCHSPPCPQYDAWRLRIIHRGRRRGRKKRWGMPCCPSLCRIEGCNLGTGHRTPYVTNGTVGFRSPSLEWHFPKLLHTHSSLPSLPVTHTSGCRRGSSSKSHWALPVLHVSQCGRKGDKEDGAAAGGVGTGYLRVL